MRCLCDRRSVRNGEDRLSLPARCGCQPSHRLKCLDYTLHRNCQLISSRRPKVDNNLHRGELDALLDPQCRSCVVFVLTFQVPTDVTWCTNHCWFTSAKAFRYGVNGLFCFRMASFRPITHMNKHRLMSVFCDHAELSHGMVWSCQWVPPQH